MLSEIIPFRFGFCQKSKWSLAKIQVLCPVKVGTLDIFLGSCVARSSLQTVQASVYW